MNSKPKILWPFAILLALSFLFHFAFLGHPNEMVFDEIHFANYAGYYLTNDYYFDIHPPLGKLMIAGFVKFAGSGSFFSIRFLPALFGSLFVLVVSWLAFLLTKSKKTALIAGFLVLADNALLIQSRLALLDIFLLFFSVLALCFFFLFLEQKTYGRNWFAFLSLSAIASGLAMSIKWTGLATTGIIAVVLVWKMWEQKKQIKKTAITFAIFGILATAVYALPFAVHFGILTEFEQQNFPMKQFSYGKEEIKNSHGFFQKFETINAQMLTANLGSADKNPGASNWFMWPLNQKPLRYSQNIYFRGNTTLWLLVIAFVALTAVGFYKNKNDFREKRIYFILLLGYFANLLPFVFIQRTTFLYHYLPALVFGIILTAHWLNIFHKKAKPVFVLILAIVAINFLFFLPPSLGLTF